MERDLTTTEAARMIGVHRQTLLKWCRRRLLPSYFIGCGKHRRIRAADVAKFVANRDSIQWQ